MTTASHASHGHRWTASPPLRSSLQHLLALCDVTLAQVWGNAHRAQHTYTEHSTPKPTVLTLLAMLTLLAISLAQSPDMAQRLQALGSKNAEFVGNKVVINKAFA